MKVKQYIKDFEKLGFGLFVHFGLYSVLGMGEWAKHNYKIPDSEYEKLANDFCPDANWAEDIAKTAKNAGCKYITLTTRHHDGYSLYDTCGLNDYDAPHFFGRDLVAEFCDACKKNGIIPFFYHTLLDWREKSFDSDFPVYLEYLRKSVEILCKNYGKIGGIWFDGMWAKPDDDWQEDELYGLIRRYQPDAMIINNTGLMAQGALGHIELDSVTFERGKPQPINLENSPKYIASEMCEVMCDHWGYAKNDLNYKAPARLIEELCECRKYGSNFLLNIGPKADGSLKNIDKATLEVLGQWTAIYGDYIHDARPSGITVENKQKDFILKNGKDYYLFCHDLPMRADVNVALSVRAVYSDVFSFDKEIKEVYWADNKKALDFTQEDGKTTVFTEPYLYGNNHVVRIAVIKAEE